MAYDAHDDGRRDFHFLYGRWRVAHRRLRARGAGCADWDVFEGESFCQGLMGGVCNIDEYDLGEHGHGLAFRTFDVAQNRWAIYWVAGGDGILQAPVFGRFDGAEGVFEGDDTDVGRPVRVRFRWEAPAAGQARWTQAFSYDGGTTWEVNWIMDFSR